MNSLSIKSGALSNSLTNSYAGNAKDVQNEKTSPSILINGFGIVGIERPMYLTNPARVVFDLPNSRINPNITGKEFKINETESLKISQYEQMQSQNCYCNQ